MKLPILLLAVAVSVCNLQPAVTTITNSAPDEIIRAVEAGGRVRLAFDGTVSLAEPLLITTNTTVDASGRDVVLDGGSATRHFIITNGATLRLLNVALINGTHLGRTGGTNENGSPAFGGSILNASGRLELMGCRFFNNRAVGGDGGAGAPLIPGFADSAPERLGAAAFGGAIYSSGGEVAATNCTFATNRCAGGKTKLPQFPLNPIPPNGEAYGGALFATNSTVTLDGVTFTNNATTFGLVCGGAIAVLEGPLQIRQSRFMTNQVFGGDNAHGGALYYAYKTGPPAVIEDSLFHLNRAAGGGPYSCGVGGAVWLEGGVEMLNCALVDNEAIGGDGSGWMSGGCAYGGGVYVSVFTRQLARFVNCTVAKNRARGGYAGGTGSEGSGTGSGITIGASGTDALPPFQTSLINTTVAQNFASGSLELSTGIPDIYIKAPGSSISGWANLTNTILSCGPGQSTVAYHSAIFDGGHNIASDASANFTQLSSRNNTDPMLAELADNGGPIPTMALLPGSPAVDAADDLAAPATDQRGVPRPVGGASDIGAFELTPKLALMRDPTGTVQIQYVFQPGRPAALAVSTNLASWLPIATGTTDLQGRFTFQDADADRFSTRFYRTEP